MLPRPPHRPRPRVRRPLVAALLALALTVPATTVPVIGRGSRSPSPSPAPSASATPVVGTPGARTLGDPFYPSLGNGGYDTVSLDLVVDWSRPDVTHPDGHAAVTSTLGLVATQDLSELSLDVAPASVTVGSVRVADRPAAFRVDPVGRKLIVTLPEAVATGTGFQVEVSADALPGPVPRTGEPGTFELPGRDPEDVATREGRGLIADGAGGVLLAAQPNGAHTLFPVNDHPADKATARITLVAPRGMLGVASGELQRLEAGPDGRITTTWVSAVPVASHVLSLGIADQVLRSSIGADGVTYRSALPPDIEPFAAPILQGVPGVVGWLADAIGAPYPFETFGLLAYAGRPTEAILEGQTLVLLPAVLLQQLDRCRALSVIAHEAAHMWFGDRAGIGRWDEKWLSEGHATYWQWRWMAANECLPAPRASRATRSPDPSAPPDPGAAFEARIRRAYREAAAVRAVHGAPSAIVGPASAYTPAIYDQGALALEALRQEVGDRTFGRIERALLRRFADRPLTTDGFIRTASRIAGRDLGPFLEAWLRSPEVPPMPGRPGWRSVAPSPSSSPSPAPSPSAPPIG